MKDTWLDFPFTYGDTLKVNSHSEVLPLCQHRPKRLITDLRLFIMSYFDAHDHFHKNRLLPFPFFSPDDGC